GHDAVERFAVVQLDPSPADFHDARLAPDRDLPADDLARHAERLGEFLLRQMHRGVAGPNCGQRRQLLCQPGGDAQERRVLDEAIEPVARIVLAEDDVSCRHTLYMGSLHELARFLVRQNGKERMLAEELLRRHARSLVATGAPAYISLPSWCCWERGSPEPL